MDRMASVWTGNPVAVQEMKSVNESSNLRRIYRSNMPSDQAVTAIRETDTEEMKEWMRKEIKCEPLGRKSQFGSHGVRLVLGILSK